MIQSSRTLSLYSWHQPIEVFPRFLRAKTAPVGLIGERHNIMPLRQSGAILLCVCFTCGGGSREKSRAEASARSLARSLRPLKREGGTSRGDPSIRPTARTMPLCRAHSKVSRTRTLILFLFSSGAQKKQFLKRRASARTMQLRQCECESVCKYKFERRAGGRAESCYLPESLHLAAAAPRWWIILLCAIAAAGDEEIWCAPNSHTIRILPRSGKIISPSFRSTCCCCCCWETPLWLWDLFLFSHAQRPHKRMGEWTA